MVCTPRRLSAPRQFHAMQSMRTALRDGPRGVETMCEHSRPVQLAAGSGPACSYLGVIAPPEQIAVGCLLRSAAGRDPANAGTVQTGAKGAAEEEEETEAPFRDGVGQRPGLLEQGGGGQGAPLAGADVPLSAGDLQHDRSHRRPEVQDPQGRGDPAPLSAPSS